MVERLKDKADLRLEALFRSTPIADEGFSRRVMSQVRRRVWIRRLALPVAFVIGASIAAKPLAHLVRTVSGLLDFIPKTLAGNVGALQPEQLPQLSTIVLGVLLVVLAAVLIGRTAER